MSQRLSALLEHEQLARSNDWLVFNTNARNEYPWVSRTYGIQNHISLLVRYGYQHRVLHGIYCNEDAHVFGRDQYIYNHTADKRRLISYILINRPVILPTTIN